jgi:WD40 repeat protein
VRELAPAKSAAEIAPLRSTATATRFPGETPLSFDPQSHRLWLWAFDQELRARLIDQLDDVISTRWTLAAGETMIGMPHVEPKAGLLWLELGDRSLEIRRLSDGRHIARFPDIFPDLSVIAAALSPDGKWFVWGGRSTELNILNVATGKRERLEGHNYEVASVIFSPTEDKFFSGGVDGLLFSWETAAPHRRRELGRHMTSVGQMAFSPDGRVLAAHEGAVGIHLWHPATGREVGLLSIPDDGSGQWLGFSPEGDKLAIRLGSGEIRIFPVATNIDLAHNQAH